MIHSIHEIVWGPWMLLVFLGIGLWFSIRSGFFQITKANVWWKETVGSLGKDVNPGQKTKDPHSVTQFQSACTALAATVGTGNIVGVATALTAGGAGAIFWMWISAVIGMMTAYVETALGIKYRYRDKNGAWICGPMVYLEKGLKSPALGLLYGFFCMMASMGMGSMVQANSISETLTYSFSFPPIATAVILTVLVFIVVLGGISRIACVSERLVPFSAGIYIIFSCVIIFSYYEKLPGVFQVIWDSAWAPSSMLGGTAGYGISRSLQYGIARGVFSNEAGLGSMAILHGAAENTTPAKQGMWAMFEVFFDTILICTLTALVILCVTDGDAGMAGFDGAALTAYCFSGRLGLFGEYLIALSMLLFAFATIIAWYYLGKQALSYLLERIPISVAWGQRIYTLLYLNAVFLGCLARLETVWELSDIWNGFMAIPNLIALACLGHEVLKKS